MAGSWYGPSVRPRTLDLGADWTINNLRWTNWGQQSAAGHGHYGECAGARGPCGYFQATVTVWRVRVHDGARYFATMRITGGHQKAQRLVMNKLGIWAALRSA
jgi:hypothetical protein